MLSDVKVGFQDLNMAVVLEVIGGGVGSRPRKIGTGLYMSPHWSFEHTTPDVVEEYPKIEGLDSSCGVCDSPSQFMTKYGELLEKDARRFAVSFVKISRAEQPPGGWRWRKWGPYVGAQTPTTEYLRDEPLIETVHTFHVYEVKGVSLAEAVKVGGEDDDVLDPMCTCGVPLSNHRFFNSETLGPCSNFKRIG